MTTARNDLHAMTLVEKTRAIQAELLRRGRALPRFGTDGEFGEEMADALIAEMGLIQPAAPRHLGKTGLVLGTGKAIRRVFIHCSATRAGQDIDAATIRSWHLRQGWSDIGYHFVIRLDGTVERGRPEHLPGSHAKGYNTGSIAMVYVGGLDAQGQPKDTRTPAQLTAMADLCQELLDAYPGATLLGHRDISPDKDRDGVVEPHEWLKVCPCFDVRLWWDGVA